MTNNSLELLTPWSLEFFQGYCWSKNTAIWLDKYYSTCGMSSSFPRYGDCTGKLRLVRFFILNYFQQERIIKFCQNSKKPYFMSLRVLPILRQTRIFLENRIQSLFSKKKKKKRTSKEILRTISKKQTDR